MKIKNERSLMSVAYRSHTCSVEMLHRDFWFIVLDGSLIFIMWIFSHHSTRKHIPTKNYSLVFPYCTKYYIFILCNTLYIIYAYIFVCVCIFSFCAHFSFITDTIDLINRENLYIFIISVEFLEIWHYTA